MKCQPGISTASVVAFVGNINNIIINNKQQQQQQKKS